MTPEEQKRQDERYFNRFNPLRYKMEPNGCYSTDIIPQMDGLTAFPAGDEYILEEIESSSEDE